MSYFEKFLSHSRCIPEEVTWEGASAILANLMENADNLTEEQLVLLVDIGALMCRQAAKELREAAAATEPQGEYSQGGKKPLVH